MKKKERERERRRRWLRRGDSVTGGEGEGFLVIAFGLLVVGGSLSGAHSSECEC